MKREETKSGERILRWTKATKISCFFVPSVQIVHKLCPQRLNIDYFELDSQKYFNHEISSRGNLQTGSLVITDCDICGNRSKCSSVGA